MLVPMLLWAQVAFAHPQAGEAKGFLTGFKHPISGLDHVLAMVAVGLWGAQLGSPAVWLLPVAFPMVMALGGMLGLMGVPLPGVEYGIAASAILLGVAVMFEVRPPLAFAAVLVAFFAIFHGHAHGTELPPGESGLLYSIGFAWECGRPKAHGERCLAQRDPLSSGGDEGPCRRDQRSRLQDRERAGLPAACRRPIVRPSFEPKSRLMSSFALPYAPSETLGFIPERLERLTAIMARQVEEKKAPGVSMLIARHGKIAYRPIGRRACAPAARR